MIRKTAAVEDIFADVKDSHAKAVAKGGTWKDLAETHLAPVVGLITTMTGQLHAAREVASPLLLALDIADEQADLVVGKVSDEVYNAVGRPASDPVLSIFFPGGNAFYVDGDVTEQPDRMALLAELLPTGIHPKLPQDKAQAAATEITTAAGALRGAVDAARVPRTRVVLLERVVSAIARSAVIALANFKRVLKAGGFTEAEIHTVIPDRGRPAAKKPAAPPAAPPATPQPA